MAQVSLRLCMASIPASGGFTFVDYQMSTRKLSGLYILSPRFTLKA
jgi:hypothetical protein